MKGEMARLSVHLASRKRMHVFEDKRQPFCLRSKRSVVRIHSGVPDSKRLTESASSHTPSEPIRMNDIFA